MFTDDWIGNCEGKCVIVSSPEPVDSLKVNRNNEITVVMSVFWALYQALTTYTLSHVNLGTVAEAETD